LLLRPDLHERTSVDSIALSVRMANLGPFPRPLVQVLAIEGVARWIDRPGSGLDDFPLPPEFITRHRIQSLRLGRHGTC